MSSRISSTYNVDADGVSQLSPDAYREYKLARNVLKHIALWMDDPALTTRERMKACVCGVLAVGQIRPLFSSEDEFVLSTVRKLVAMVGQ